MVMLRKPAAVVCDIEGTTTSMRFWCEVLSPFIQENIEPCLRDTWGLPETIDTITLLRNRVTEDRQNGDVNLPKIASEDRSPKDIIDSVTRNVQYQMQQKRQSNELKSIQLLVCLYGYQNEILKGHVYRDVSSSFKNWHELGIRIFIYASGSTLAQKMLFACSLCGNLGTYIEDYFNAESVGRKTDQESYRNIAKKISEGATNILFLSDNPQELKAATSSGVNVLLVVRTHNREFLKDQSGTYRCVQNFEDIEFF